MVIRMVMSLMGDANVNNPASLCGTDKNGEKKFNELKYYTSDATERQYCVQVKICLPDAARGNTVLNQFQAISAFYFSAASKISFPIFPLSI